jgi:hypothetical protein
VAAVTKYVARRLVERERALAGDVGPALEARPAWRGWRRWRMIAIFALGLLAGIAALFAAAWLSAQP